MIGRRRDRRIVVRSIFRRHRRSHAWRMHKLSYLIGLIGVAVEKLFYIKGAVGGRFDYRTGTVALFGRVENFLRFNFVFDFKFDIGLFIAGFLQRQIFMLV
jgi:hypothetical protein